MEFSGSSKRTKPPTNIIQVSRCSVDGCSADLRLCREYHRRHKVCEIHSKSPKVIIKNHEKRFCQQCSRFHSLAEFDEQKRSCRKRLDGHNRRRRKPQPDSHSRTSGLVSCSRQGAGGTRFISFGSQQIVRSSWAELIKAEDNMIPYNNQVQLNYVERHKSFSECSAHGYKGVDQIPLVQESSVCRPLVDPTAASGSRNSIHKSFSDGLNQVIDSDRALSLLSMTSPMARELGMSHTVQSEIHPQAQTSAHNLHYRSLGHNPINHEVESKPVVSGSNTSTLHLHDVFQAGSTSGSHQMLTFMWECS